MSVKRPNLNATINSKPSEVKGLHPRNQHVGRYPLADLVKHYPALKPFIEHKPDGSQTIQFSDPNAVKALNGALLDYYYQISFWDIPAGYLCPPIPGRADYVHHIADLLAQENHPNCSAIESAVPMGKQVQGVDIGTGANVIYPILASRIYGWRMVGTDIDKGAVKSAKAIVKANGNLSGSVNVRHQSKANNIFSGVVAEDEFFDFCMCNPPFHRSAEEAQAGSLRKKQNLAIHSKKRQSTLRKDNSAPLNFAGQSHELWCKGGELAFIQRMLEQSLDYQSHFRWFTCLVSKKEHLKPLINSMQYHKIKQHKVVEMAQGQKVSRFIAWRF